MAEGRYDENPNWQLYPGDAATFELADVMDRASAYESLAAAEVRALRQHYRDISPQGALYVKAHSVGSQSSAGFSLRHPLESFKASAARADEERSRQGDIAAFKQAKDSYRPRELAVYAQMRQDFPKGTDSYYQPGGQLNPNDDSGPLWTPYSARGRRLRAWAARLHEHPVDPAAYPGIELTPRNLLRLEEEAITSKLRAASIQSAAGFVLFNPNVDELLSTATDAQVVAWHGLSARYEAARRERKQFLAALYLEKHANPLLAQAAAAREIVENVTASVTPPEATDGPAGNVVEES